MQVVSSLNIANIIRTNITSSLAVNPNYNYFAALTRELSTKNSQWIYRLDYYDFNTLKKLESIDVYQTYNADKHFLTFIPHLGSTSFLAVSTTNDIIFYSTDPLKKMASFLHQQSNVYDLKASPDGALTVLVGQKIVMYRNKDFKQIMFPQQIENARFCDFSKNGHYMVIASTNSLNIYTYIPNNDDYTFQQIPLNAIAPVAYGSITSVQFNPTDSEELIVGFLDASPMAFSVTSGVFFKKLADTQPKSSQNAKIAKYMPDGQRYYSFDYLNGVGLWPGSKVINNETSVSYRLYYAQNFLLYDATCNKNGTVLIGFVWQSIKIVQIRQPLLCQKNDQGCICKQTVCSCKDGYIENYSTFQCEQLSCLQSEYATGKILGNNCQCKSGYIFDLLLRKCVIDCSQIQNALLTKPNMYECYCANNWSWNAQTRKCVFDCTKIAFSKGISVKNYQCACTQGFIWNQSVNECVCPAYMQPQGGTCVCINYYYVDPNSNKCIANCSSIISTLGQTQDPSQCLCQNGYYYTIKNKLPGCQLSCKQINDTIGQSADFTSCICREHMDWFNNSCVVNCKVISYSDPSGEVNNTCSCAINYLWIDKIKECAKNCSGVKNTIKDADSTLISCPCRDNFAWNQANSRCEIQCSKIPNSQDYSLIQIDRCECRPGFDWNTQTYSCKVDCDAIWNSKGTINESFCSCIDDQPFNNQTLTCPSAAAAGLFSSKLAIIGFSVGIVVVIIIMIILVKFCWKFSTDVNKEGEKKIKMIDGSKKKGKLIKGKEKVNNRLEEDDLKTNERLNTPKKSNRT